MQGLKWLPLPLNPVYVNFTDFNLSKPLLNALADLEFELATPVQAQSFPVIMSGSDVVCVAQTGTGKTLAYLLPLLRQLPFSDQRQPRILILVPTRELVLQVVEEIQKLTTYMNLRYAGVYGGTNIATQGQLVYEGLDILVATPGRLYDLTLNGVVRLKSIQTLVIDEVDEMLNLGFRPQLVSIMETLPAKRQNLMFSATLSGDVERMIQDYFEGCQQIVIAAHGTPLGQIVQKAWLVPNFYTKVSLLTSILNHDDEMNKVLVFVGSKKLADRLHENMAPKLGEQLGVVHSNKSQNQRINTLKAFDAGEIKVLIATDLMARGLDISNVSHVVNFDMPDVPGDYIHRIGRTGRAGKDGIALAFVNKVEEAYLRQAEELMRIKVEILPLPTDVVVSPIFADEERPVLFDKNYLKAKLPVTGGAFHEKKDKNKKQNLGGPGKRNPGKTKTANRGQQKRKK